MVIEDRTSESDILWELQELDTAVDGVIERAWSLTFPAQQRVARGEHIRRVGPYELQCGITSPNLIKLLVPGNRQIASKFTLSPHCSPDYHQKGGHFVVNAFSVQTGQLYMIDATYKQYHPEGSTIPSPDFMVLHISTPEELIRDLLRHHVSQNFLWVYLELYFPKYQHINNLHVGGAECYLCPTNSSAAKRLDQYVQSLIG